MVDALATRADEGRGYAAKSSGELLTGRSGDLRMGQPTRRYGRGPQYAEASGGTETSNVPRGKETIPVVVANEPGEA